MTDVLDEIEQAVTERQDIAGRLDELFDRLDALAEKIGRVDALLTEFEPVIRAVLDPAASGPLAWAVRRKTR